MHVLLALSPGLLRGPGDEANINFVICTWKCIAIVHIANVGGYKNLRFGANPQKYQMAVQGQNKYN